MHDELLTFSVFQGLAVNVENGTDWIVGIEEDNWKYHIENRDVRMAFEDWLVANKFESAR